jgi:hypothetical protein
LPRTTPHSAPKKVFERKKPRSETLLLFSVEGKKAVSLEFSCGPVTNRLAEMVTSQSLSQCYVTEKEAHYEPPTFDDNGGGWRAKSSRKLPFGIPRIGSFARARFGSVKSQSDGIPGAP